MYPIHHQFGSPIRKARWPPSPSASPKNPCQHLGNAFPTGGPSVGNAGGVESPPPITDIVQSLEMGGGIAGLAPATAAPRRRGGGWLK